MRLTNFPSASSAVAWTRGTPFWSSTVSEGYCAPAGGAGAAVAHASRARRRCPALTSEAMVETHHETQGLPRNSPIAPELRGGHRLLALLACATAAPAPPAGA